MPRPLCRTLSTTLLLTALLLVAAAPSFAAAPAMAPPFALTDLRTGATVSLEQFRGRTVLLDFWASWCAPCVLSFRALDRLQNDLPADSVVILAVSIDAQRADAEEFLSNRDPAFRILHDPSGAVADAYRVADMPHSILIAADGRVVGEFVGFRPESERRMRAAIAREAGIPLTTTH